MLINTIIKMDTFQAQQEEWHGLLDNEQTLGNAFK